MEQRKRITLMLGVEDNAKLDILAELLDRSKMSIEREAIKTFIREHDYLLETEDVNAG